MKDWKSHLVWSAIPFFMLAVSFGLISAVNWDYESKLVTLNAAASNWNDQHLGPILLGMAIGMAAVAGLGLFLVRILWPKSWVNWFILPLTLITILLIFPGLFIIILGPAAITMTEQMNAGSK